LLFVLVDSNLVVALVLKLLGSAAQVLVLLEEGYQRIGGRASGRRGFASSIRDRTQNVLDRCVARPVSA